MSVEDMSLDIDSLLQGYREGRLTPPAVTTEVLRRIDAESADSHNIWISRLNQDALRPYLDRLESNSPEQLPLFGIPFAIKDNIDLAGLPTTAGCAEYAYEPKESAQAVALLIEAGAIPIGKTNLDQFATGLVGTRSPYGPGRNSLNSEYISGGSSSGSALAVALGLVSFALGTDTAGSGRVPAAFNNIIGLKPARGRISTRGVVPACRSLDCVSVFSLSGGDAERILDVCARYDEADAYSRRAPASAGGFSRTAFRFGVPATGQLEFFGNEEAKTLFDASIHRLEQLGGRRVEIDFAPFLDAAKLLYEGPWVSERYAAIEEFIRDHADAMWPVTREIISAGASVRAVDAFRAQYRLQHLKQVSDATWESVDFVVTPTAGCPYTIAEIEADPVRLNSNLGYYTNFMNLLDLSACAVPAGFQQDGLPFGVTLFAPAFTELALLSVADALHRETVATQGALSLSLPLPKPAEDRLPPGWMKIAVCGAHLSGLPLNAQLTERCAYLLERTSTTSEYRLYALPGGPPLRPGMVRAAGGAAIEVELWALPLEHYGSFVAGIPAPLGMGMIDLISGETVQGFLCESHAIEAATDITRYGGWRAYLESRS